MNAIQNDCLELLKEIQTICKENNLNVFLDPETTAKAKLYKGFKNDNDHYLGVLMTIEEALKFMKICNKMHNEREFECMDNSGKYPSFSIMYINSGSTYINFDEGTNYNKKGNRIVINFIRKNKRNFLYSMLEKGWELNGYLSLPRKNIKDILSFILIKVMLVIGRQKTSKIIFKLLCNFYKNGGNEKLFVRKHKGKRIYYNSTVFSQTQTIQFENQYFYVPLVTKGYISKALGKEWQKKFRKLYKKKNEKIIYLENISYKQYLNCLNEIAPYNKTISYIKANLIMRKTIKKIILEKDKAWIIAKRSGDRLSIYEDLMKKKNYINECYNRKQYVELDKIFSEYKKKAKYYLKYNLSLCPNEYFLRLLCERLDEKGEYIIAEKLINFMPEKHRKSLLEERGEQV